MRITRATIAGIIGGILLLAVLSGYAIGLPKAEGGLPSLPDRLDSRFVAISAASPDEIAKSYGASAAQAAQITAVAGKISDNAKTGDDKNTDDLTKLYGDATVRSYIDSDGPASGSSRTAQLAVTVVKGESGLVIPNGPFQFTQDGQHYVLQSVDGYQCAVLYTDPQAATATTPATGTTYLQSECRGDANGMAYDVFGSGLSAQDVAGYLHRVITGDYAS